MGTVSDHGGNNYLHKSASFAGNKVGSSRSVRCDACGKLSYVLENEFLRAKIPSCYKCGGRLEETDRGHKRRIGLTKRQVATAINLGCPGKKPLECEFCGERFRSPAGMSLHVRDNHKDAVDNLTANS